MSYGVNTWGGQAGRARAAGSSKRKSTRTAKRSTRGSAPRARKSSSSRKTSESKLTLAQRRRLHALARWQQKEFWEAYESKGNPYYSGKIEASLAHAENLY